MPYCLLKPRHSPPDVTSPSIPTAEMCVLEEKKYACTKCKKAIYTDTEMKLCIPFFLDGAECGRNVVFTAVLCDPALCLYCTDEHRGYRWVIEPDADGLLRANRGRGLRKLISAAEGMASLWDSDDAMEWFE
ncbi:hypothetical protein FALBO_5341 [Fusarium albosuccineum]|uniref:Uncharacterized protein n=1 Tax=Fusarium albosuccineum TaxID=1237068 RepID=A0A8H4PKF9_9HYPO|nr:hypothetical protein FALBO_5341 [Fusarium albosuccineum]